MTIDEREIARLDAFAQWCRERANDPVFSPAQVVLWSSTAAKVEHTAHSFRRINEWEKAEQEHIA